MSEASQSTGTVRPRLGRSVGRVAWASFALLITAATVPAQPASPVEVAGESLTLSYASRHFDGVTLDVVVLTAKSVRFITDTLGAWTPYGEGTTSNGFVLRHRRVSAVFVTLCPFVGPGPGRGLETWRGYQREVARWLGPEATTLDAGESGAAGGTPGFASWATREAVFIAPATPTSAARTERHIVASDGTHGILIMLAGPATDVANAEQDFRFLLARLERQ